MHEKDAKVLSGLLPSVFIRDRTRPPLITANVTMPLMASTAVVVRPERVYPAADVSNVFVSILTVPKLHNSRLSYQLMSWIQSFNPKQVYRFQNCMPLIFTRAHVFGANFHIL